MLICILNCFLQLVQRPTPDGKQKLAYMSRQVAESVSEIVRAAEAVKGKIPTNFSLLSFFCGNILCIYCLCYISNVII